MFRLSGATAVAKRLVSMLNKLRRLRRHCRASGNLDPSLNLPSKRDRISHNDLSAAEAGVEAALRHLEEAQSLALGHHGNIAAVRKQAEETLAAVRAKAVAMKASIDALLERTDQLLSAMSSRPAAAKDAA